MFRDYLKSKTFFVIGLVLVVLMGYLLSKELNRRYRISREIEGLEQEIARFDNQNEELSRLVDYLQTPEYQERQARPLLNLQKSGEFAVALPPAPEDEPGFVDPVDNSRLPSTNYQLWWNYFFAPKNPDI